MLRTFIVVSALIALASAGSSARISPFGIVEGITDCGSAGELGTVEVPDCTRVPCILIPNKVYDIALRFKASVTSANLALQLWRSESTTLLYDLPINGVIEAGVEYELKFQVPVLPEFANQAFGILIYILDEEARLYEVCAELAVAVGPLP